MSRRYSSSSSSSDDDDFEQIIYNPSYESPVGSPRRREESESPVLVEARDVEEEEGRETPEDKDAEIHRLRLLIEGLDERFNEQEDQLSDLTRENQRIKEEREKQEHEITRLKNGVIDSSTLVSHLIQQLEAEKEKHAELKQAEEDRIKAVEAENQQLKEAVEKLEKLSIGEVKQEVVEELLVPKQEQNDANLLAQIADRDARIEALQRQIDELEAEKASKLALKEEKRKLKRPAPLQIPAYNSYGLNSGLGGYNQYNQYSQNYQEPYWSSEKRLKDELQAADQQIGIIVEHNDYLRTVEANEHSQELAQLRQENEQLNQTICYLKQQLL